MTTSQLIKQSLEHCHDHECKLNGKLFGNATVAAQICNNANFLDFNRSRVPSYRSAVRLCMDVGICKVQLMQLLPLAKG